MGSGNIGDAMAEVFDRRVPVGGYPLPDHSLKAGISKGSSVCYSRYLYVLGATQLGLGPQVLRLDVRSTSTSKHISQSIKRCSMSKRLDLDTIPPKSGRYGILERRV